jgi:hypothetical protein
MRFAHFLFAFFLYTGIVSYLAFTTPITPYEAKLFATSDGFVSKLMHEGHELFGGFLGFRLYFMMMGVLTVILFYVMSKCYFSKQSDSYTATTIFMFLPGMLTASTLANIAIVIFPFVLLFVVLYLYGYKWLLLLSMLPLYFLHEASIVFFIAILLYAIVNKAYEIGILSFAFIVTIILLKGGIAVDMKPSGHFMEIFGLYGTLFSPLLFIFFFYALYRTLLGESKHIVWYIGSVALFVSLILSIRQRIVITDFAPYMLVATVVMLQVYHNSLRVRLPLFQKGYKLGYTVVILVLVVSSLTIVFHRPFYTLYPNTHFAKRVYAPYTLAKELQAKNIPCYDAPKRLRYQLQFYGIEACQNSNTF